MKRITSLAILFLSISAASAQNVVVNADNPTGISAFSQTPKAVVPPKVEPIVATPSQQKEFKALVEARTKAQTEYDAELTKLPEYVAFNAAKKALEAAAAKVPKANLDAAQAKVLDAAYRAMAELKLSSREYEPTLDKGELVFTKVEPKKPN